MNTEDTTIEHLGVKIVIPKELADTLDLAEVKQDFVRTVIRIKNRYGKPLEKK